MRIISQDKKVDVPYEISSIEISHRGDDSPYAIYANVYNRAIAMAVYATEEKCKRVMRQLLDEFMVYMAEANPDGSGFCFIPPRAFIFPEDEI